MLTDTDTLEELKKDLGVNREVPKDVQERLEKDLEIYENEGLEPKASEIILRDKRSLDDHIAEAISDYRWMKDSWLLKLQATKNLSDWFEFARAKGVLKSESSALRLKDCEERCAKLEQEKSKIAEERDHWHNEFEKLSNRRTLYTDSNTDKAGNVQISDVEESDGKN